MENKIKPIVTNQTKLNKTLKSIEIDYNVVKIFSLVLILKEFRMDQDQKEF